MDNFEIVMISVMIWGRTAAMPRWIVMDCPQRFPWFSIFEEKHQLQMDTGYSHTSCPCCKSMFFFSWGGMSRDVPNFWMFISSTMARKGHRSPSLFPWIHPNFLTCSKNCLGDPIVHCDCPCWMFHVHSILQHISSTKSRVSIHSNRLVISRIC